MVATRCFCPTVAAGYAARFRDMVTTLSTRVGQMVATRRVRIRFDDGSLLQTPTYGDAGNRRFRKGRAWDCRGRGATASQHPG